MLVVTGGLGFIGQNLVLRLIEMGFDVKVLDTKTMTISEIQDWFITNSKKIKTIFHMGAITDTTCDDIQLLDKHNYAFSIFIWSYCNIYDVDLIYASSAATYGMGENGFDDREDISKLMPLNLYAKSKQKFDEYALSVGHEPEHWYGLKFFNVYGFGESHKDKMASMVFHGYNQIKETGEIKLFKSYENEYDDGEQKRDFIYVDGVVDACIFLLRTKPESGIYNVGTGKARSFNDLANAIFKSLGLKPKISYIAMPESLQNQYQYFTEAKIDKLREAGFENEFDDLETGVLKYIQKLKNA